MMEEAILKALLVMLSGWISLWAIGRAGPMCWRTDKFDMAALGAIFVGGLAIAIYALFDAMPTMEFVVAFFAGLARWLIAAPVSRGTRYERPTKKRKVLS